MGSPGRRPSRLPRGAGGVPRAARHRLLLRRDAPRPGRSPRAGLRGRSRARGRGLDPPPPPRRPDEGRARAGRLRARPRLLAPGLVGKGRLPGRRAVPRVPQEAGAERPPLLARHGQPPRPRREAPVGAPGGPRSARVARGPLRRAPRGDPSAPRRRAADRRGDVRPRALRTLVVRGDGVPRAGLREAGGKPARRPDNGKRGARGLGAGARPRASRRNVGARRRRPRLEKRRNAPLLAGGLCDRGDDGAARGAARNDRPAALRGPRASDASPPLLRLALPDRQRGLEGLRVLEDRGARGRLREAGPPGRGGASVGARLSGDRGTRPPLRPGTPRAGVHEMAVRVGFEPTVPFRVHRFSRPA